MFFPPGSDKYQATVLFVLSSFYFYVPSADVPQGGRPEDRLELQACVRSRRGNPPPAKTVPQGQDEKRWPSLTPQTRPPSPWRKLGFLCVTQDFTVVTTAGHSKPRRGHQRGFSLGSCLPRPLSDVTSSAICCLEEKPLKPNVHPRLHME